MRLICDIWTRLSELYILMTLCFRLVTLASALHGIASENRYCTTYRSEIISKYTMFSSMRAFLWSEPWLKTDAML
jgi:hypothetical protein